MNIRKALFVVLGVCGCVFAYAQKEAPVLEMHAVGDVWIAPDGHVSDYKLRNELLPAVAELVAKNVRSWTFEPILVDGKPVTAKTAINLNLKAEPVGNDSYSIRITSLHFGSMARTGDHTRPPRYPPGAVRAGVGAKVLLAVRIDDSGQVVEALPMQTNLDRNVGNEADQKQFRTLFEKASIAAAKSWRYNVSETLNGKPIGSASVVPVEFWLNGNSGEGRWKAFVPGPINPVPWLRDGQLADNRDWSDIKDGEAVSLDSRFKLKNDVIGKTL